MAFGHQQINLVDNSRGKNLVGSCFMTAMAQLNTTSILGLYTIHNVEFISAADRKLETVSSGSLSPGCLVGRISHQAWVAAAMPATASLQMQKGGYL